MAVSRIDKESGRNSIWLVDLSTGRMSSFVDDDSNADAPIWSIDGREIHYTSDQLGSYDVWTKPFGRVASARVTLTGPGYDHPFEENERALFVYRTDSLGNSQIWALPKSGQKAYKLPLPNFNSGADISMNGRWLVRRGMKTENARGDIFLDSLDDPSLRFRVTSDGGAQPAFSHDGGELYYLTRGADLIAVPFDGEKLGTPQPLFRLDIENIFYSNRDYQPTRDRNRFLVNRRVATRPAAAVVVLNRKGGS